MSAQCMYGTPAPVPVYFNILLLVAVVDLAALVNNNNNVFLESSAHMALWDDNHKTKQMSNNK